MARHNDREHTSKNYPVSRRFWNGLSWALLFLAAGGTSWAIAQESHPQDRYRVRPDGVPVRSIDLTAELPTNLLQVAEQLKSLTPIARIGVQDRGPMTQMLGKIERVEIGEDGFIYVLDSSFQTVRVFDATGAHVTSFGQPGQGPGEFVRGRSAALDQARRLFYVADASRTLHRFSLEDAGEFSPSVDRTIRLNLSPEKICIIDHQLYAFSMRFAEGRPGQRVRTDAPNVLHALAPTGEILRSFGPLYDSPYVIANMASSWAHLSCDPVRRRIFVTAEGAVGETHAFDLVGRYVWIARYQPFRPIEQVVRTVPREGIRQYIPDAGFDRIAWTALVPTGDLLVSVEHVGTEDGEQFVQRVHYALVASDGTGGRVDLGIGRIVAANERFVVSMSEEPNPVLTVYAYSRSVGS